MYLKAFGLFARGYVNGLQVMHYHHFVEESLLVGIISLEKFWFNKPNSGVLKNGGLVAGFHFVILSKS